MASERVERKLTTILASDVVGYSRLTGAEEELTLARLRTLRSDLIDPIISVHRGRVVKRAGDGSLVEFHSVVDAVRCAIEVQNGMVERNVGMPAERRIEFRVGIHVGDVMVESDGDLMGDGVNVAARLEGICEPNGICLSEDAYRQVRARLDLSVTDLGEKELKNIAEKVHVFSISVGKPAQAKPATVPPPSQSQRSVPVAIVAGIVALVVVAGGAAWYFASGTKTATTGAPPQSSAAAPRTTEPVKGAEPPTPAPARLSIVVLPFANLSGDPGQDYFADSITDELTTALSRLRDSFVIARSTAFTYKIKPVDVKQIGRELGVRYVLEGSTLRSGDRVRVNAQLIDTESGGHLWADQFDEDRADLLQMQDEIVGRLARTLDLELIGISRSVNARTGNPDAQDLALQCRQGAYAADAAASKEKRNEATALCERALQLDPDNVLALTYYAYRFLAAVEFNYSTDPTSDLRKADELLSHAFAIDPNFYIARYWKANLDLEQGRPEEAIAEAKRSLAMNPSYVSAYIALCRGLIQLGRAEEAIESVDKAIRLSPRDRLIGYLYYFRGVALLMLRRDDEAVDVLRLSIAATPGFFLPHAMLSFGLEETGHNAEARAAFQRYQLLSEAPKTVARLRAFLGPSTNPVSADTNARLFDVLRKLGMAEE